MNLHEFFVELENSSVGTAIRESTWLFPTVETVHVWDRSAMIPTGARIAGAVSLIIWVCVVSLGRWIGFTT